MSDEYTDGISIDDAKVKIRVSLTIQSQITDTAANVQNSLENVWK